MVRLSRPRSRGRAGVCAGEENVFPSFIDHINIDINNNINISLAFHWSAQSRQHGDISRIL